MTPGGDTYEFVKRNVRFFKLKNCNVAISSTRTSGGSVEALQGLEKEMKIKIEWVRKL